MNLVAIETATETVGVAVRTDGGTEAEFLLTGRRRHVESLAPALEHLLAAVGLEMGDLGAVAVDVGPGLFTGLRVGVSAAKGLAQALGIGVVGLSSLDILTAAAARLGHRGLVLAAVDARRGEVFAGVQEVGGAGAAAAEVIAPRLFTPPELVAALKAVEGRHVVAVGDGVHRYAGDLGAVPGVSCVTGALGAPPPLVLLSLAVALLDAGAPPVDPARVVPLYMREADAISNFARIGTP